MRPAKGDWWLETRRERQGEEVKVSANEDKWEDKWDIPRPSWK